MIAAIKTPILESVEVICDPKTSKISKLRAAGKLWRALQALSQLPEPTIENTWHPNSHNLIRLKDGLLGKANLNNQRKGIIRNLFNLVIIIYDFDPPWRWMMDSVKDKALEMNWKKQGWGDDWVDGYNWWVEKKSDA